MSESTSKARPLSEQLKDESGAHEARTESANARSAQANTATAERTADVDRAAEPKRVTRGDAQDPHYEAINERVNRENQEMEARNAQDGWFPVFLEWIPFAIIAFLIVTVLMAGMLLLDPLKPFPFFN